VLTSEGQVVQDHRRLPADLEPLPTILRDLGGPVTVTVEATLQWAWLHDRLTQAGFPVCVAHPQPVKRISHARCKTDPIDARKLAELTRAKLLPTIWVPPPEVRAWRQLVRGRATLVRLRTRAKNRIHACLAGENCRVPTTDLFGWGGRAWLTAVSLPPTIRREIQVQLALITVVDEQLRGYDGEVKRLAAQQPAARLLQTIPGVGRFGALLLRAEIGRISRFASSSSRATSSRPMPAWCRAPGAPAARRPMARSPARGAAG